LREGDRVVVIEDVVTTGGSSMQAVEAVRASGCEVRRVLAIVDREEGGRQNLAEAGLSLEAIFTASELLKAAG
jgi:orotate phosphoribosyltransferase